MRVMTPRGEREVHEADVAEALDVLIVLLTEVFPRRGIPNETLLGTLVGVTGGLVDEAWTLRYALLENDLVKYRGSRGETRYALPQHGGYAPPEHRWILHNEMSD